MKEIERKTYSNRDASNATKRKVVVDRNVNGTYFVDVTRDDSGVISKGTPITAELFEEIENKIHDVNDNVLETFNKVVQNETVANSALSLAKNLESKLNSESETTNSTKVLIDGEFAPQVGFTSDPQQQINALSNFKLLTDQQISEIKIKQSNDVANLERELSLNETQHIKLTDDNTFSGVQTFKTKMKIKNEKPLSSDPTNQAITGATTFDVWNFEIDPADGSLNFYYSTEGSPITGGDGSGGTTIIT